MYTHQCNMVRSIPSLKMVSMPSRRVTIMAHSANANAPKNGDSIESSFLFPYSFIIPITSVYVQHFAYIFDLGLCIHCAYPSVLTAGPQRYTPPQKHENQSSEPTPQNPFDHPIHPDPRTRDAIMPASRSQRPRFRKPRHPAEGA